MNEDLDKMDIWNVERKLENIANEFFLEKRRIKSSLLRESPERLNSLRKEYRRIANYHLERFNALGRYKYYVI